MLAVTSIGVTKKSAPFLGIFGRLRVVFRGTNPLSWPKRVIKLGIWGLWWGLLELVLSHDLTPRTDSSSLPGHQGGLFLLWVLAAVITSFFISNTRTLHYSETIYV